MREIKGEGEKQGEGLMKEIKWIENYFAEQLVADNKSWCCKHTKAEQ